LTAGIVFCQKRLFGWLSLRGHRFPGGQLRGTESVWVTVVITRVGLLVWVAGSDVRWWPNRHIDIPHGHPLAKVVRVQSQGRRWVTFGFDAETVNQHHAGQVELRVRTRHTPDRAAARRQRLEDRASLMTKGWPNRTVQIRSGLGTDRAASLPGGVVVHDGKVPHTMTERSRTPWGGPGGLRGRCWSGRAVETAGATA
jgi:hypothetical protein